MLLSRDGECLVRMGPWCSGYEPEEADLAVAFYRNGRLLKQYSTADLIKDKSAVTPTASHYFWRKRTSGNFDLADDPEAELRIDHLNVLHLKTIEGTLYKFAVQTGDIKSP